MCADVGGVTASVRSQGLRLCGGDQPQWASRGAGAAMTPAWMDLAILESQLPTLACQQRCQESCGPIEMSEAEWERIAARIGNQDLSCDAQTLTCPLLVEGQCSVYPVRPMICRLWGLTEAMRCPHGCEPARWLSRAEADQFLAQAEAISDGRMHLILPRR